MCENANGLKAGTTFLALPGIAMKIVLMLACAVFAWTLAAHSDEEPNKEKGRSVALRSQPVVLKDCMIRAVKTARLATDRPGVLADVQPKEGDAVAKDKIVARLMDDVAQASLDVAKLVADDQVEIKYATKLNEVDTAEYEKDLEANRQHFNTVPDLEVRRAKLAMERSSLQIDKAIHEMKVNDLKANQAEAELKTYRILAPFDGVVTKVLKNRGEAVHQGDTILEVVNTDVVRIEGKVDEKDVWSVRVGSPVTVRLNVRGAEIDVEKEVFHGHIGFVDVVANGVSFDTRVWAEVPNPRNILRPGLLAIMTIEPAAADAGGLKTSMSSRPQSGATRRLHP
jgi:membrane fusion protein (multidrug efflux system)